MGGDSLEDEKVAVRELDGRGRTISGVVMNGRIRVPSLAGILEMFLKTAPLVPFESAICRDEKNDEDDDDDRPNLGHLNKVTTEIVNHGGVNLIAERDGGSLRNGEDG